MKDSSPKLVKLETQPKQVLYGKRNTKLDNDLVDTLDCIVDIRIIFRCKLAKRCLKHSALIFDSPIPLILHTQNMTVMAKCKQKRASKFATLVLYNMCWERNTKSQFAALVDKKSLYYC